MYVYNLLLYVALFLWGHPAYLCYAIPFTSSDSNYAKESLKMDSKDNQIIPNRLKKLMGIFRCNGWGAGCMAQYHSLYAGGGLGGMGRGGGLVGSRKHPSEGTPYGESFVPFFTLTSGGSWGPTGKRSVKRGMSYMKPVSKYEVLLVDLLSILANEKKLRRDLLSDLTEQKTNKKIKSNDQMSHFVLDLILNRSKPYTTG